MSRIAFYDLHRQTGGTNTKSSTSGCCPLTPLRVLPPRSTCQDLSLPTLTQDDFGCPGRHMEACINPKITCCGFQPVSLSATHARHAAVVCARAEPRGKLPRSGCLQGKRWQIHDGLSRWGWTGGNEHRGSDQHLMYLRVTRHGFSNMSLKGTVSAAKPPATLNADPK